MSRAAARITLAVLTLGLGSCSMSTSNLDDQGPGATASPRGSHRAQVARARALAAKAEAAAEAELEIFPLVRFLGSQTQREAVTAQARLDELLARPATGSTSDPAAATLKQTGLSRATAARPEPRQALSKPESPMRIVVAARSEASPAASRPTPSQIPLPPSRPAIKTRTVDAIIYDAATGIKTVHMSDGSVEESLFEPAELPSAESSAGRGKARVTILNREATASD